MRLLKHTVLVLSLLTGLSAAMAQTRAPKPPPQYDEYYTIDEASFDFKLKSSVGSGFEALPHQFSFGQLVSKAKSIVLNLLRWTLHSELRPLPEEQYMRKLHFGRWINDPMDNTCMNTRARVLVRDSEEEVGFRGHRNCVVDTGKWKDPYSGRTIYSAKEIQVDHMVPLKSAYLAGAHSWDYKTRCLYSNYEGYRNHLVPSSVRENTSKGDRGPEKYLPADESYRCQYIKDWLAIKLIWKLNLTPEEVQGIETAIEQYNCNPEEFRVSDKDLREQRNYISENIEFCMIRRR